MTHTKTININGFEVPEPLKEAPIINTDYFCVNFLHTNLVSAWTWCNQGIEYDYLAKGLIHLTKEAAELHAKALLSFTTLEN